MMHTLPLLTSCFLAAHLPQETVSIPLDLQLIEGESRRDVACAQRPLEPFTPVPSGTGVWETKLPRPAGAISIRIWQRDLGEATSRDRLWIDIDRDGVEAPLEVFTLERRDESRSLVFQSLRPLGLPMELMVYGHGGSPRATAISYYHFACSLVLEGESYSLLIVDKDLDGSVSLEDRWALLDERQQAFVALPDVSFAANLMSEPWYVGEKALRLELGETVRATLGPAAVTRAEFLAERAARVNTKVFKGYDEGREAFLKAYEIDPQRPVDPSPPRWYYAWDIEEALAFAQDQGRPLWVEFMSDGCPWCKRYDWLNDKDAEVTQRLRRFTLVKICRDLDPGQTAEGLGLNGVPCHALFDLDGDARFQANGWLPPSAHAKRLDEAWAALSEVREVPE